MTSLLRHGTIAIISGRQKIYQQIVMATEVKKPIFFSFRMQKIDPKFIIINTGKKPAGAIKSKNGYCNLSGKRVVLDAGGGPVKWYIAFNNETKKYINHYMNGTEFQTGSCTISDESDGACAWVCTAEGPEFLQAWL